MRLSEDGSWIELSGAELSGVEMEWIGMDGVGLRLWSRCYGC